LNFVLALAACAVCVYAETITRAEYSGGTVVQLQSGASGRLKTGVPSFSFETPKGAISVHYSQVNLLEYGQNASRRIVLAVVVSPLFLLSKSRRHYLTIGYKDEDGVQQAMVLRLDKSHVRATLASLEARTGLRIEYQDDEARKAGRG